MYACITALFFSSLRTYLRKRKENSSDSLLLYNPSFFPSRFLYPSCRVPLGKCWRRGVAPSDLTIDKGIFSDLLNPERRKEMSSSSYDKYPQGGKDCHTTMGPDCRAYSEISARGTDSSCSTLPRHRIKRSVSR